MLKDKYKQTWTRLGQLSIAVLLMGLCLSCAWGASQVRILGFRQLKTANSQRLVFELNKKPDYRYFLLSNPQRLVIDFKKTQLKTSLRYQDFAGAVVKSVRGSRRKKINWRIVLDLRSKSKFTINLVTAKNGRVAFTVNFPMSQRLLKNSTEHVSSVVIIANKIKSASESNKPGRKIIIVIDPGHGGKDPGATGPRGTHEKDVVLRIAKDLQRDLNRQFGFKALLTRNGDYYLHLRQRLNIARRDKADMFIAIHADAYKDRSAQGASVFALSERGATSEAARWLAEKENKSELMGGVNLADKGNMLKSVLIDLSQSATISASLVIGRDVLGSLKKVTRLHHNRVEQAAFVVLKSPDIPSLLVETGFLSNPREELRLRTTSYRHKIAYSLMKGIVEYYHQHPPRGTLLAQLREGKILYAVKNGDTLSGVALRYRVSMKKLKSYNRLSSNRLRIGQVLRIPTKTS